MNARALFQLRLRGTYSKSSKIFGGQVRNLTDPISIRNGASQQPQSLDIRVVVCPTIGLGSGGIQDVVTAFPRPDRVSA
jgi:hypothetical protein